MLPATRPGTLHPGHALAGVLDQLAAGEDPAADASVLVVPPPPGARAVVVGGSAWHVVAADVDPAWVGEQTAHDRVSSPLTARFLVALADRLGLEPEHLDSVLVGPLAPVRPGIELMPTPPSEHPRVVRALQHRTDVRVWTTPDGAALLALGRGICRRWEVSVEVDRVARGRGLGTALAAAAPALVPGGGPVWAQVAPANLASLRSFLAAGYRPVCAEVLLYRP